MNLLLQDKPKFMLLHFLLWVGVWFFFVYFFSYNSGNTRYVIWFSSLLMPVTMLTTYTVIYYLIPKYLLTKKYVTFVLYSVYTLIISTYFIMLAIFGSFIFMSDLEFSNTPPMSRNFVFILILVYLVVLIVSFIAVLNNNFKTISKNKELQNKILTTQLQIKEQELYYLKKQIHPHFLFNTLNTIYALALKQAKDTPKVILKLSNLLDYILYQVNKPMVSLQKDIQHIEEYIDLEKIRFHDTLKVNFISDTIPMNIQIAPMLLIPFVENAFKHGNPINGYLSIEIICKLRDNSLDFSIKNTTLKDEIEERKTGIGLKNIKKRLDLSYQNKYSLTSKIEKNWYQVNLHITELKTI